MQNLPHEIAWKICLNVDNISLFNLLKTCRLFSSVDSDKYFWKEKLIRDYPILDICGKKEAFYQLPFDTYFDEKYIYFKLTVDNWQIIDIHGGTKYKCFFITPPINKCDDLYNYLMVKYKLDTHNYKFIYILDDNCSIVERYDSGLKIKQIFIIYNSMDYVILMKTLQKQNNKLPISIHNKIDDLILIIGGQICMLESKLQYYLSENNIDIDNGNNEHLEKRRTVLSPIYHLVIKNCYYQLRLMINYRHFNTTYSNQDIYDYIEPLIYHLDGWNKIMNKEHPLNIKIKKLAHRFSS